MAKRHFRAGNAAIGKAKCNDKNFEDRVRLALRKIKLESVRKFSRKTRRYRAVYLQAANGDLGSYDEIEKLVAVHKCHRNVLDQFKKLFDDLLLTPVEEEAVMDEGST